MTSRHLPQRDAIRLAIVHGEHLTQISARLLGGVTRQRTSQIIRDLGLSDVGRMARAARDLTYHHSLIAEGLYFCRFCGLMGARYLMARHNICTTCNSAICAQYIRTHPASREQQRAWQQANRDKTRLYCRTYARRHPDRVAAQHERWKQQNPERAREIHRAANIRYRERKRQESHQEKQK